MDLQACPVELGLDGDLVEPLEGLGDVGGGGGQHGLQRHPDLQADGGQRLLAAVQGCLGDRGEVAREHRGAAHEPLVEVGRTGDGLHQQPLQGALAQLAEY